MESQIRPICGRVLLQIVVEPERNVAGIYVKSTALREGFRRGVVRRLPDGYRGDLEEGQHVLVPPFAGSGREFTRNGDTLVVIKEEELQAALEA